MLPKILRSLSPIALVAAAFNFVAPAPLVAQATSSLVTTRLTQPIDENARVTLKGTVHPLASAANDRGAAPNSMLLSRLTLVLKRSDAQESALKQLISDLHTPGSASYHKWLTPDAFGKQFGPSDQDLATIQSWLASQGFSVTKVNAGRQSLEFSGNVSQFRAAFHTQIHKYMVNGETHYANSTDPQIPAALAPVVTGFASLNNFRARSPMRLLGHALWNPQTHQATPQWTYPVGTGENFAIAPGDFAMQYDVPNSSLNPSYTGTTYDGTGQTIAIVNESNINIAAVNAFRSTFGLPANPPQVIIDGNDPGIDGINNPDGANGASGEAYLDVEWSGAVAPGAQIDLVIAADTALESGLYLAMEHAVYANVAPIISLSFLGCEQNQGTAGNAFINNLWEQAAAQGITVMVSSGDGGSAGCDNFDSQQYAVGGLAVNGLSSTPYNVSVGGTDFYYSNYQNSSALNTQLSTYWNRNATNSPVTSLLTRIPEQPWNDSQYGLDVINLYAETGSTSIAGGSGGASTVYTKPSWQTGAGVPSANTRFMPDVSLFAADGLNYSYYAYCGGADGDCQGSSNGNPVQISGAGGTSISSPAFAGIMALVNQKYGRQGQADFVLYPLAAQYPLAFHDVTVGTNSVPCNVATTSLGQPPLDCISVTNPITVTDSTYGTAIEGQLGTGTTPDYNAVAGYDLASGLGSVDASVLLTNWGNVKFASTATTLTPSSTSFTHGTSITVSGSVTPGTATGNVALMTDSTEPVQQGQGFPQVNNGTPGTFALTATGTYTGPVNYLPGGTYNIWGQYSGDGTNAASTSEKSSITVSPENSGIYFNLFSPAGTSSSGSITSGASIDYGTQILLSAQVAPSSQLTAVETCFTSSAACPVFGIPTGTVAFADGGSTINTAVLNAEGDAQYNAPFAIGSHSVAASYNGDNSYNKSTASAVTFTVVKDTPAINLTAANQDQSGDFISGQPTVFNIQVANGAQITNGNPNTGLVYPTPIAAPTGTVTVSGFPSGTSAVSALSPAVDPNYRAVESVATVTAPSGTPSGNYNVTIKYSGDSNYNSTSSSGQISVVSQTGGLASTTTATVVGSISPTTNITITGTVTGQSGHPAPTGGIIIYSSGYPINGVSVTPGSGDSSTFSTVLNSQNLSQGANIITLQYTGDSNYYTSAYQLGTAISNPLSDFSMIPSTTIVPVTAGASATDVINLSSVNGFSGTVNYTCTAASGLTCSLSPGSTAFTSGSSSSATLTIGANSSTTNGNYNVLITGTGPNGLFVHTLNITAVVSGNITSSGLTLSNSGAITVPAGSSGTSTITVAASGGFTGVVNLSCAVTTSPAGATNAPTCAFGHGTVDLTTGAPSLTSTLTVSTVAATTLGSYVVTVTGTDAATGKIMGTTPVNVTVTVAPNIALSANPASLMLSQGATTGNTSVITVTPSNGFTGSVALTASVSGPSGATSPPTISFNPSSVSITGASAGTSTATVATTASTTVGTYTVTITGTAGSDVPTTTLTVIVTAAATPTFAVTANPSSGSITAGSSATATVSVTPGNGFTGSVPLTCAVAPTSGGVACSLSPTSVSITGTTAGTSTLTITTSSNSAALSHPLNKFFAVGGGMAVACLLFFGIPARRRSWRAVLGMLLFGAIVGIGIGCGSSGNSGGGGSSANYTVTVTGTSGSLTESASVAITVNSQ